MEVLCDEKWKCVLAFSKMQQFDTKRIVLVMATSECICVPICVHFAVWFIRLYLACDIAITISVTIQDLSRIVLRCSFVFFFCCFSVFECIYSIWYKCYLDLRVAGTTDEEEYFNKIHSDNSEIDEWHGSAVRVKFPFRVPFVLCGDMKKTMMTTTATSE